MKTFALTGLALFAAGSLLAADCVPTASDARGPFHVRNTPVVDDLNRWGKNGQPMRISGEVRAAEPPHAPIAGARIEIWQTDGDGRYYPQANGDYADYADADIDLRGSVLSDADGRFSVMSLFPAPYEPRPPHIHYQITAPGRQTLVTQHYLDRQEPACRSADVDRSDETWVYTAPTLYLR